MWKPSTIFLGCLLVIDTFFVSYAIGLNSKHVLVEDLSLSGSSRSQAALHEEPSKKLPAQASVPTVNSAAVSFTDLGSTEQRLQSSLNRAAEAGILDPARDKHFRPNDPVTRADFTRWMVRVRQVPTEELSASPTYSDVDMNNPYYKDIEGATRSMMVQGYNVKGKAQKQFKPDQYITRQEFAVMYGTFSGKRGRAEKLKPKDVEEYLTYDPRQSHYLGLSYKDVGDIDDWARKWVAVAHQAGVLEQCFDVSPYAQAQERRYLHPQQKMTRAEAVNILVKLYGNESRRVVQDGSNADDETSK